MTQPTKAALQEAKRALRKGDYDCSYCLNDYDCQFCEELLIPIATALTTAEERGRKTGEERILELRDALMKIEGNINGINDDVASELIAELALIEDDALAAKEN